MALLSTYQKFKEKNTQGGQSEPQKQETQKENSDSGLMSTYQQFMSKKQGGTQAVSPAQDYNQRVWDVLQRVDSANASRNGGWSADVTGGNGLEINALLREYDAYEGDKSGMTDYRNMLLGYNKQMQELNGYYSKFRDSDDYDRQRSGYGNFGVGYSAGSWGLSDSEAREIRKQQSQKDAQESQRALAEYTAAKKEFAGVDQEYRIHSKGDSDGGAFSDEYDQELTDRWNAAKAKVDSAENALRTARDRLNSYNATWGKIDQYAGDAAAAKGTDTAYRGVSYDELTGWENRRQEEQAAQDAQAMMPDHAPGALKYTTDTEPQVDDALGLWRSMTQQQRQDAVSSSNGQLSKLANEGAASYWDLLTDDEVSTYYYIRNQRGQEAANQYLEDMYIELTRRNEAGMVQGIENASALEKTGMVAASVGANLLGAIPAAMGTTADLIAGRKNPYSGSGLFKRYASYVRGAVGQDIGDWTEDQLADKYGEAFAAKAGEFANQTFQAFMSGVDSVAGGKFFGQGLGIPVGPFDMHVGGYTTVMGLGAFADRAQEMQLKGATTAQIALGAIGSGVLEALFEDVSMEAFFTNILDNPATTLKEFTKKLAVQMGVEASEEVFTEIGNILWDGIVMGKNSDTETATREYMAQGMTEQEARQRATLDNIQDIVWAGYGGAISAGAMAAGGQAIGSVAENYAVGKELQKNGRAVDLQEQAASLTNEKKRAKLQKAAAEVAHNASVGDKSFRNTYRTGKVATQIAQQAGREAKGAETAEFRKAAEKYLEGQRGIQNKKHALNVLTRAYDGTAMLPGDKAYMRMIGGEKLTQEILNSVGGKETLQENAKPSVEASMRTIGNVQSSVLGIAPETKAEFDSDNSGQAFRKSDSEPINILASEPIAKVENGILYLNTDDGQEIAASDVSYGNSGEAAVYAAISNMQTDTETARSLLSGIDDSGLSSAAYARAIRNAYYRGMNGVKFEDTPGYSDAAKLPETQRRAAWEAGKQRRAAKVQEQEALIDSGKAGTRESGVTMQESAKSIRSLNKQQQTGMAAAKALAAAGLHVEVYASTEAERKAGKPNGIYRKADGSIAIDLNAGDNGQGAVAYALAHETTHFIKDYSPAKYEAYAQMIIAAAENKGISYDSLIARQMARLSEMEEYKGLSETELQEIAYDETIAEMSETILTDTDAANRLSQQIYKQDRTLWQKIKDFFTGLVEKLRNAYKDSDPDSDIGRMLKRAVQDNTEIAQAWAEAVAEAGENYQLQDGQKKNAREGVRYSLRGTTDGKTVAVVDEDILSNIDLTQWNNQTKKKVQAAAKEALKKFSDGIVVDGVTRNVNRVSRREFAASDYSEMLSKKAPQLFADKMRTASAIDDVVIATTDWARDGKLKHPRTDNFVDFDHGRVLIKAGENQYSAEVVVGITDKGTAVFYDVVDIQPAHFQMQKEESPTDVTTNKSPDVIHGNSSEDTLPQQATEVKGNVRYSARQETKNLVALHNLTEEKFLKTLEIGGFPMPSIAITKADIPHTNFGDITVVFGKDTIDPKANRKNAAYSADAWTPTVPRVEYEMDSKVADRVYNRLGTLKNQVADYFQNDIDKLRYDLEDRLNREGGEEGLVKSLSDNYALKAAFLEEQGQHIEQKTRQEERTVNAISSETEDKLLKVWDILGDVEPEVFEHMPLKALREEYGTELEKAYPGMTKSAMRMSGVLRRLSSYLNGTANTTETYTVADGEAMKNAVDAAIDQEAYENWVKELFGGAEKSRGIYNRKDRYTPSGNLRSFKDTHIPATLDGIVQAMAAENGGNSKSVSGFNGIGTLRAATAEEFKSIADMHKREGRLQNLTEDQVKQIQGNLENRLYQLMNTIDEANPSSRLSGNPFIRMDGIGENLVEVGESGNYTPENVKRVFAKYGMEVSDQTAQEAVQLLFDVTQMPVNIFEAKPKRAVRFEEIKNVLIPDTASQKLIRELDSRGIPYQTYKAGNEAQRQKMVNQMEDIRFSDRNSQSRQVERLEKKNAELKAEAEYLKQVVNVQKSGNKAHILDRSSVNAIGKGLMESVNAKGSEFGKLLNDFYRALGTEDISYETMQDRAGELADWLLEHHQAERDGYAQDILDFLKKRRVSLSDGQIGDIEYSYGSLNDFKRAIKGSIILDQNAETSLDQLWQEAAAQFPDRFGADVMESNMPDGLAQIVSWANSTESSSEAEFQYYRAEQKADLTQKVLMGYLEAKPMESVSDNMKKELEALKEQHKKEIKQLRKEWDAEAAAMEKSHAYDLKAEKKRSAAAIDAMKAAQAAIDKANAALWEVERNEIKLSYDRQMAKLRTTYSTDTAAYQNEFFEALKSEEYKDAKSPTLRRMLKELANEKSDGNKDAETSRKQVYENLRQQYELEKDIGKLEAKVKQQREAAAQKVESRKKTEERHKLQNTIDTLNKYLLQPTNTAHVPQGLQSSVAMALRAINGVIGDGKAAQNADRLAEYAYRLRELEKNPSANADKIADLNRKIQNLTGRDSSMKAALAELQEQYHKLETQGNNLYDSNIEALIQNTMEQIGDTEYRNLSLQQLKAVRDSYTALLTTIRNANKAFVAGKNARIDEMVKRATTELSLMKKKNPNQTAVGRNIEQFFWNNEKPVYAFERIGSAVMIELYDNLRKGEDTFYRDVSEARDFFLESAEKNGFSKWDLNELKEFTAANGQKFQLSLDELMSLYAYSLRPQAREHLTKGGIVLGENTKRFTTGPLGVTRETTYNDANAYTLTDETIDAIAGSLTKEQRQFAFEMQQYLAKIMGAKGDEVNMALYGIKKFGEETYWPLKSSDVFSERVRAQQENTGNKLKNKGFTKALTPKANNAIELSTLTETWAEHVSDMSMYHSFTLPMEDFYRVYNWNQKGDGMVKSTMGVRQLIQKTAGKGAVNYIDQFLKDLNGGLRADPRETVSKAMLSGFKKAAVSASLSVAIQQPSAVGRALAYIEPKYFIGSKVEGTKFAETWEQLKKYAAVAGLKEMGRFDVDMGRSTLEYIIGRNGLSTWGKITDKVDEFSGWLPEMADQVTWCAIWEAAKRKTQAQNPGLHGEALLQKAGELFTDTITRTQVYDSVFSRSANMRDKNFWASMATAFMAEPTTTANMVEDAIRKFQKGDKRMSAKMLSSVAVATVLNAALAAVVYAARDDDKDKTYWEKYLASLAGETADSFNPLTYVPIVADINNLLMGYSIERTDMSLASDLVTALKKIFTLYQQYDDDWDEDKKSEWKKKVESAWLDNVLLAGTVTGLPLKNIYRDTKAAVNIITNPSNGAEMSADTILNAMLDSAKKSLPVVSWIADESSSDQLYKAITQGKTVLAKRMKAQFKSEAAYESAVLKGLRENDPRITQAAQCLLDKNTPKRVAIIKQIVAEGNYTQDQVIKAVNQKANSMKEKSESSKDKKPEKLYDYDEFVHAAANGLGYSGDVMEGMISYQADRNQEKDSKLTRQQAEEDAQKTFRSGVKKETKDGYSVGELTEEQVRKALLSVGYWDEDDVEDILLQWNTELTLGGEIDWSDSKYLEYAQEIEPAGISAEVYDEWLRAVDYELKGEDADGDGKIDRYSAIKQKAAYINALPLTAEQKDALFATVTDSARTRRKYKLW